MGPRLRQRTVLLVAAFGLALLAGCLTPGQAGERLLQDHTGVWVDVSDTSRIVATSHDLVEILFAMGHGERIVGVPGWIDFPEGRWPQGIEPVDGVPAHLGRPHVLNAEEVLAVGPTLVLEKDHPLQPTPLADQLRRAGVPVFVFANDETLDNVRRTIDTVADIMTEADPDARDKAIAMGDAFDAEIQSIRDAVAASEAPRYRALYQLPVGFVAGKATSADLLLDIAGATNIAGEAGIEGYRQVAKEVIVDADPERIVADKFAAASPDVFFNNTRFRHSTAAELAPQTLLLVDPATTALVGLRFPVGVRIVAEWLHPAAFGFIDPDVQWTLPNGTGRLDVDSSNSTAFDGPVTFRFQAGDGSPAAENDHGRFSHTYASGSYTARLLVIDAGGRIHETNQTFEVLS